MLRTEGRVTMIDGILAVAVLLGLALNAALGWWWADPAAGCMRVYYAAREVRGDLLGRSLTAAAAGILARAGRTPARGVPAPGSAAGRALALGGGVVEAERGGDDGSRDLRNELAQLPAPGGHYI